MSISASVVITPLREGDRLTREEFLRRWEAMPNLKFAELIDGIVYMPSPISIIHRDFHRSLSFWLGTYVVATPCCEGGSSGTWLMSKESAPLPDLDLCIRPESGGQSRVEGDYAAGAPEFIAEVSHTTIARDAGVKLQLYERSGVREYLIVRPKKKQAIWHELVDGKYREIAPSDDGILRSRVFPGLWLDTLALWSRDLPGLAAAVQRGVATAEHAQFVRKHSAKL